MPFELGELLFLMVAFAAYFVGTVLGFASSVLSVTFGALLLPLDVVLAVVAPLNVALSGYIAIRHRHHTLWRALFRRILPLVGLGVPFGLLLFNLRGLGWLRFGLGAFVFVLAALQLWSALGRVSERGTLGAGVSAAMLFGGGLMHGLYGTGGPMIVYVLGREIEDKGAFRSTVATMFIPMTMALIVDYALVDMFTPRVLSLIAWSVIPVLGGVWLGEWAHRRFDNESFKLAVWVLLLIGGIILTVTALARM